MKTLSLEQLIERAPAIATQNASSEVSDKYSFIPSTKVIEDVMQLGWSPVSATQRTSNARGSDNSFAQHMVNFRIDNPISISHSGDVIYPQITFVNSHDGKSTFRFYAGLFRLVCSNGLVVKSTDMGSFKLRHMGYTFEELQTQLNEFVSNLDGVVEKMNKMVNQTISVDAAKKLAQRALQVRFNDENEKFDDELLTQMITPIRVEDEGDSLWKTFNVIQERIIEGDFQYKSGSKMRKARKIKNFQQDMKVNQQLWELAEEFVN